MDTKLGTGLATGMFYHAPAGTALPTSLTTQLPGTWKHVGDVSDAGIIPIPNPQSPIPNPHVNKLLIIN